MEREPLIDPKAVGTIAANLLREGGAAGGNSLAENPSVKVILMSLEGISTQQIKEVLDFLSNGHSGK